MRVPYIPDFVKDDIRQQVRSSELRQEVVSDVMQKAKSEKWGLPGAWPEWVDRFKLSGDIRLRSQNEFMGPDNIPGSDINNPSGIIDWQTLNERGGFQPQQDSMLF